MHSTRRSSSPEQVVAAIAGGPPGPRALLFDFDGTLVDFGPVPGAVRLPAGRRELLRDLAGKAGVVVGFISGRRLDDIRGRVDVPGAYYAGLHGLEIEMPGGRRFDHPSLAEAASVSVDLANRLASVVNWPGVWIEYKGAAVAVHWRTASSDDARAARQAFGDAVTALSDRAAVRLLDGDAVCEAVPDVAWDKGGAVRFVLDDVAARTGARPWPAFLGDDWTDEAGFLAIGDGGVSVCVGPRPSIARFRLAGPAEVERLLRLLRDEIA